MAHVHDAVSDVVQLERELVPCRDCEVLDFLCGKQQAWAPYSEESRNSLPVCMTQRAFVACLTTVLCQTKHACNAHRGLIANGRCHVFQLEHVCVHHVKLLVHALHAMGDGFRKHCCRAAVKHRLLQHGAAVQAVAFLLRQCFDDQFARLGGSPAGRGYLCTAICDTNGKQADTEGTARIDQNVH